MLNRGDIFHHTSLDTMDKVDPTELRRSCFIALGSVAYLAAAEDLEALDMALRVVQNGTVRMAADTSDEIAALFGAKTADGLRVSREDLAGMVGQIMERELAAARSTLVFAGKRATADGIENICAKFAVASSTIGDKIRGTAGPNVPDPVRPPSDRIVPVRAADFVCPLETDYLVDKLGPAVLDEIKLRGNAAYEALNFVDGRRSLQGIWLAVSAEFGPLPPGDVEGFFKVLERAGLVKLEKR
jgi:hypothetical protein